jgi:predicted nuclease of predicted toxin-antitoxin system
VRFLIDAQLSPNLVLWFKALGHDAVHVFDLGRVASDDRLIWQIASTTEAIIVTKDKDFVRYRMQAQGPQVLYIQLPYCSTKEVLNRLESSWPDVLSELESQCSIVEIKQK